MNKTSRHKETEKMLAKKAGRGAKADDVMENNFMFERLRGR
jgi:hypothetical protein